MTISHGRPFNRGASVLSALVFVALLAGAATTIQYFSPMTAANKAAQVATTEAAKETKNECRAGEVNVVSIEKGKVQPKDDVTKCWDTRSTPPKQLRKDGHCANLDVNYCRVVWCETKGGAQKCQFAGEFDSTELKAKEAFGKVVNGGKLSDLLGVMEAQGNLDGLREKDFLANMDSQTQKGILDAFKAPITGTEEQIKQVQQDRDAFKAQLDELSRSCATCTEEIRETEEKIKKKEAEQAALEKRLNDLRATATAVQAPKLCSAGETGAPPNCRPINSGCIGSNCGPGNSRSDTTGFGGGNPMSALGSLLSGLAKAIPAQPQSAPAQACSTDPNIYAQQQQQYQQQLQQYNYQMQQYQYQQQLNQYYAERNGGYPPPMQPMPIQPTPCTPSTGSQCQAQPQQPPPSACSSGYWRATYSGACIVGWQCVSTEGPKAELVCEPDVADVGTTLAITYNCSSGVASSSSFKVTTQPGGSAITTVKAPPAGTNTATYTLACTESGKTTGAQCSVKVNRPNIILVANPQTVPANGTSLISWLTTGMDKCVISSPDQPDFTQRNSSNTSVTGAATTSSIATSSARFLLHCETLGGGVRDATTTVSVGD